MLCFRMLQTTCQDLNFCVASRHIPVARQAAAKKDWLESQNSRARLTAPIMSNAGGLLVTKLPDRAQESHRKIHTKPVNSGYAITTAQRSLWTSQDL